MSTPRAAVVVGVDGSEDGRLAVEWGAAAAAAHQVPLHLMHVVPGIAGDLRLPADIEGELRDEGAGLLAEATGQAAASGVQVTTELVVGSVPAALVTAGRDASMIVLGAHGHPVLPGLGSVSDQVAQHAPCPVVVVREPANPAQDRVVVGVDGSADAQRAIGFAFDIAARNNAPLTALYGWPERRPGTVSARSPRLGAIGERIDAGERLLAESLAGWAEKYPDVSVIGEAVPVRPARLLVDASEQAALLVVGSRGRGGFAALLLGSVSRAVLHHARCAVAVVR